MKRIRRRCLWHRRHFHRPLAAGITRHLPTGRSMPRQAKAQRAADTETATEPKTASLARFMSQQAEFKKATIWIVGTTPLIVHSSSEKAKREMLSKQVKATKPGKVARETREGVRRQPLHRRAQRRHQGVRLPGDRDQKSLLERRAQRQGHPAGYGDALGLAARAVRADPHRLRQCHLRSAAGALVGFGPGNARGHGAGRRRPRQDRRASRSARSSRRGRCVSTSPTTPR